MRCTGECKYLKQKVDNLRDFETWTIHWFTREITISTGASGPGKAALRDHAASLTFGRYTKACARGCVCKDGQWGAPQVQPIILRMGDSVYGAIAICTADLTRREYVGRCRNAG